MIALRRVLRCESPFKNVSRICAPLTTLGPINSCALPTSFLRSRNISLQVAKHNAVLNSVFMQRRSLATEPEADVKLIERVYYGTLTPRMRVVKMFSLLTSMAGLAAQPILMEQGVKIGGTAMAVFLCGFAGFFTFVTPLLLHFITKKYVTEIHYNPTTHEYTATTINIFLQKVKTKFHASDVNVPDVPGMFTTFNVGKKPLFVDPSMFEDPEHYVRIMGYDKPIDFKLDLKETATDEVNKSSK